MTVDEQMEFLSRSRLRLAAELRRTPWGDDGLHLLRHMPTARSIIVTKEDMYALGLFAQGATGEEVVTGLLKARHHPGFASLYGLMARAHDANILVDEKREAFPPAKIPKRWSALPPFAVRWCLRAGFFTGLCAFFFWTEFDVRYSPLLPDARFGALAGIALASLAMSFGSFLASCTILAHGGTVRYPRPVWKIFPPHLGFDHADAAVAGPPAVRIASMLRVAPSAWLAFACMFVPELRPALPVAVGLLLWIVNPFRGPVRDMMRASCAKRPEDRDLRDWFFAAPRTFRRALVARFSPHGFSHTRRFAVAVTLWTAAVFMYAGGLFVGNIYAVFTHGEAGIVPALAAAFAATAACHAAIITNEWVQWRARLPAAAPVAAPLSPVGPRELALLSPVLSVLPDGVREDVADSGRPVSLAPGARVSGIGVAGEDMCVVCAGEIEVLSRVGSGDETHAATLRRGDVFGELPMFGPLFLPRNLRAVGRAEFLVITEPTIEQMLMRHLSVPAFGEAMRFVFFRELPLLVGCLPSTVAALAAKVRVKNNEAGTKAFAGDPECRRVAIVFDGEYEIIRAGKSRGRLRTRDTFGEDSALRSEAPDELAAVTRSTLFIIRRDDLFALCGSDPVFALRIEENASRRLGAPVLPYTPPA